MSPAPAETQVGAAVEVEDLTWSPTLDGDPVLQSVSLRLEPGSRVLLAGASGSGKSTLLRALAGVLEDTAGGDLSGTVAVGGLPGLLLQDPADAIVARTAGRDVAFGPECVGVGRAEIWERVRAALTGVSFPYGTDHETRALSGGEAQRLALAGVVALRPGLLMLDEPCSMLDPRAAAGVRDAVVDVVRTSGATLVVVEHRLEHWTGVCDRLVVLGERGRVVADGPTSDVLATSQDLLTELGLWVPGGPDPAPTRVPDGVLATPAPVVGTADLGLVTRDVQPGLASWQAEHPPRVVLEDVRVTAEPGEVLALTGPSGAGKSTAIACLAGLLTPARGGVDVGGDPATLSSVDLAARIGWVPQSPELPIVAQTVEDEVLTTSRALGLDPAATSARARALLDLVGLGDRLHDDPHRLSGGEQRRLALVAALVHGPSVLLLDEPTVGQDRRTWSAVAGLCRAHAEAGGAVVVSTHDTLLAGRADRAVTLDPPHRAPAEPRRRGGGLAAYASALPLLLVVLVAAVAGLTVPSVTSGLALLGAEVVALLVLCGLRWPQPLLRLGPLAIGAASLWWSNWMWSPDRDAAAALLPVLRMSTAALPGVLLGAYLEPFALGDQLGQRLRLPARPVVAVQVALQRFDELRATYADLRGVRRVRGLLGRGAAAGRWSRLVLASREAVALTFALLVLALRQAGRMSVAMEARGYSSPQMRHGGRTWAEPARWGRTDPWVVALAVLLALVAALV